MKNIKIVIEYDGTNFLGWQIQPEVRTVQGEIEKTLNKITGESIKIHGSGRTDSGVHAIGQVATFKTTTKIPVERLMRIINQHLPEDITIVGLKETEPDFHARYSASGKHYQYRIYNSQVRSSLIRNHNWHIDYDLNIKKMIEAIPYLVGEKDYRTFMASGSSVKTTIRRIYGIEIKSEGQYIYIDFKGNGFLYNMVRNMTRLLVDIGAGREKIENIAAIIKSGERSKIKETAPPQGLYLVEVFYN